MKRVSESSGGAEERTSSKVESAWVRLSGPRGPPDWRAKTARFSRKVARPRRTFLFADPQLPEKESSSVATEACSQSKDMGVRLRGSVGAWNCSANNCAQVFRYGFKRSILEL